jgi:hypothetical protein
MRINIFGRIMVVLFSMALGMTGCGGGGGSSGTPTGSSNSNNPAIYSQSASTKVQVSTNGVVNDPTSGMTFAFPNGGIGTITTAKATSVVDPPYPGGTGLQFTYSASEAVTLRMADNLQTNTSMFVWGNFDSKGSKWYPASPRTQSNGYLYFDLYIPATSPKKALQGTAAKTVNAAIANSTLDIYVVQTPKSAQQQSIKDSITTAQNAALNAMDAALGSKVRASIASSPLNYVWQNKPECYYDAFEPWLIYWRQANPTMVIEDAAVMLTNNVPSHEIGHYLTHMIFGNDAFMALVDAGPPENPAHAIGLWYDKQNIRSVSLIEDYAHYLQFVETGSVSGNSDPKKAAGNFFRNNQIYLASDYYGLPRAYDPKVVDIPSAEGFATVLMAYCTHTDPANITDFKGSKTPCPAVGAKPGELLNVYQNGNIYIGGLLNSLRTFVENKGYKDAMTVIAERVGWSYHGEGKVLINGTTTPVPGVEVINVVTVNGTEYEASRGTSNAFGTYKLDRVFPGTSQLKYMTESGLKTVNITIREDQSTTQSLSLNILMMQQPTISSLSPNTGAVGSSVVITGTGLGTIQGTVTFNGETAIVTSWSNTQISTTVPTGAKTGNVIVKNNATAINSNGMPFTITVTPPPVSGVTCTVTASILCDDCATGVVNKGAIEIVETTGLYTKFCSGADGCTSATTKFSGTLQLIGEGGPETAFSKWSGSCSSSTNRCILSCGESRDFTVTSNVTSFSF